MGAIEAMVKVEVAMAAIGMVLLVGVKKVAREKMTLEMETAMADGLQGHTHRPWGTPS